MKKLVVSFVLFISLISASFAENFFAHRFFEIKVDVPVNVSNNLIGLTDVLQESVVIDLPQMADNIKFVGAAIKANAAPSVSINLDIPRGLIFGLQVGAEADVGVGLSKDLFEFLGHGTTNMGNDFTMKTSNTYADLFATVAVKGGWNFKQSSIAFTGTAFSSLVHFDAGNTFARVYINEQENTFGYEANLDAKLYSAARTEDLSNVNTIVNAIKSNSGFDITGNYERDLFRFLSVGATARIPIVPSKLSTLYSVRTDTPYGGSISIDQLLGTDSENEGGDTREEEEGSTTTTEEKKDLLGEPEILAQPYSIHRPMKIGVSADFHPFGTLLTTTGYLGLGFRHPFAAAINKSTGGVDETQVYVDYSIAGRLSLWNILSLTLSHSYLDEIFKNELALALNIRLVEVDAGVSFQSPSFTKSFTGAGVGAFVTVCVGF